jgi:hypothetical protein
MFYEIRLRTQYLWQKSHCNIYYLLDVRYEVLVTCYKPFKDILCKTSLKISKGY